MKKLDKTDKIIIGTLIGGTVVIAAGTILCYNHYLEATLKQTTIAVSSLRDFIQLCAEEAEKAV